MEQMETTAPEQPKSMSALSGVTRVLFSPRQVFDSVREKPNWILPLVILILVISIVTPIIFPTIRTEILANITNNPDYSDEQKAQILEQVSGRITLAWILIPGLLYQVISFFVMAAVFFFVANILMGGEGKFAPMLSVTLLSQLVTIPEDLIKVPLILAKQTVKVHTDLSLFLPSSMDESFLFKLLSQLDIFGFWKIYLVGLGMAVLYKFTLKKSMTAAFTVWGIYVLIAALMGKFLKFGMG